MITEIIFIFRPQTGGEPSTWFPPERFVHLTYSCICFNLIFIFLTTGVISEIGVTELTHAGLFIDSRTFRSFEIFIVLTILYIILSLIYKSTLELFFKNTLGKRGS